MNVMLFFSLFLTLFGCGKPAYTPKKVIIRCNVQIAAHKKITKPKIISRKNYPVIVHAYNNLSDNDHVRIVELASLAKGYSIASSSEVISGISKPEYVSNEQWGEFIYHVQNGGKWILLDFAHTVSQGQHFIAYEGEKKVNRGLISGAAGDVFMPLNQHPQGIPHNHLGLFRVLERIADYRSQEFHCPMPNSLFYHNGRGHAIHACQAKDIKKLGTPASHGCTRTSPKKAKELFDWAGSDQVAVLTVR